MQLQLGLCGGLGAQGRQGGQESGSGHKAETPLLRTTP